MRADHRARHLRTERYGPGLFSSILEAPAFARAVRPGQFAMLEIPGRVRPYLRRAYSVADARPESGEVEFLVKTIGAGTAALEELPTGSPVGLLGPLGNVFSLDDVPRGARVAIVAGGIGAAPFPLLYRALAEAGIAGDLFLGGRGEKDLAFRRRFDGIVNGRTHLASDDGALGEKGFVTEVFRSHARQTPYARVFACGPMPMFRALAKIVSELRLPAEFSTEAEMGCGFGVCLGCVIPAAEKPFLVSCTEGPILPPEKVAWEKL
ncbi:MAG TPA: dihydroorotate dehydrogenase electron transfer subunit [Thermoanaerobaculia bacterium]|nr:dihydroorotate dehydrogenase electron transfer subunit [Thermoanaerobaculia bacterium]